MTGFWQFIQAVILLGAAGFLAGGVAGMLIRWEIRAFGNALIKIMNEDREQE